LTEIVRVDHKPEKVETFASWINVLENFADLLLVRDVWLDLPF